MISVLNINHLGEMVNNGELTYFHRWDSKPIMKNLLMSIQLENNDENNSKVLQMLTFLEVFQVFTFVRRIHFTALRKKML